MRTNNSLGKEFLHVFCKQCFLVCVGAKGLTLKLSNIFDTFPVTSCIKLICLTSIVSDEAKQANFSLGKRTPHN